MNIEDLTDLGPAVVMVVEDDREAKRTKALESYVNAVMYYMREHTEATLEEAITVTRDGVMAHAKDDPGAPARVEEELARFADDMRQLVQEARDLVALVDGRVRS